MPRPAHPEAPAAPVLAAAQTSRATSLIGLIITLVVVWLLQPFGVLGSVRDVRIR